MSRAKAREMSKMIDDATMACLSGSRPAKQNQHGAFFCVRLTRGLAMDERSLIQLRMVPARPSRAKESANVDD